MYSFLIVLIPPLLIIALIFIALFPPKMHFLCRWFGHKIGGGYYEREGGQYFNVKVGAVDGINRVHCHLHTECDRCGKEYQVGMMHLPQVEPWIARCITKELK